VRRNNKADGLEKAGTDQGVVRGRGVLQLSEQHSTGDVGETEEAVRFLIAFTRALIRENPSGDKLYLAMAAASDDCKISQAQAKKFVEWVMEQKEGSHWPKGFF
jgi:hypothetical protein